MLNEDLTYEEFKDAIANKVVLLNYYELFFTHIEHIAQEVLATNIGSTSKALGVSSNAFTPMYKLALAITRTLDSNIKPLNNIKPSHD